MEIKKTLPKELQKALMDNNNFEIIWDISEKFGVFNDGDGPDILDNIFERTIKGELSQRQISFEIKNRLNTSQETANEITNAMNSKIFAKYKKSLEKIYTEDSKENFSEAPKEKEVAKEPELQEKEPAKMPKIEGQERIDDILATLSKEIAKEKDKRKEIDEKLKDHIPQKISKLDLNSQKKEINNTVYREKIEKIKNNPSMVKGESGKRKKIL